MFRISGGPGSLCDGLTRRELLRVGGLSVVGFGLPQLLAAEARKPAPGKARAKSCLLIFMEGGPSHIDLFDMKPDAPAEVRGEFKPIATSVNGITVGETLPQFAKQMHHLAQVRSVHHTINDHNAGSYYMLTGRSPVDGSKLIVTDGPNTFPPYGAVLARLRPTGGPLPDFVHVGELQWNAGFDIGGQKSGFFGARFEPLVTGDASLPGWEVPGLVPAREVPLDRLRERASLVGLMDRALARLADDPGLQRRDVFYQKAMGLIASPQARQAFDLSKEPRRVRERYGLDPGTDRSIEARKFGGLPHLGQCMLLARRLIEAGVRLVTVMTGRKIDQAWDTHRDHFPLLRKSLCPMFDRSVSALLEDMHDRGLLKETLLVIMGEFGRTPKLGYVTSGAGSEPNGRDHWPFCYTVMLGGGGVPGGLIHGSSDRYAAYPSRDPVKPEDIAATIYEIMGIPSATEIHDPFNQPHRLIQGQAIRPLLS
jgi:hypothetical protein